MRFSLLRLWILLLQSHLVALTSNSNKFRPYMYMQELLIGVSEIFIASFVDLASSEPFSCFDKQ